MPATANENETRLKAAFHPGRYADVLTREAWRCKLASLLVAHPIPGAVYDTANPSVVRYKWRLDDLVIRDADGTGNVCPIDGCSIKDMPLAYSHILRELHKTWTPNTSTEVLTDKYLLPLKKGEGTGEQTRSGSIITVYYDKASEIIPENVDWIIPDWLAAGVVTILSGPPGCAKSTMALQFARCVKTGKAFAEGCRPLPDKLGNAVIVSGEDATETVVRPRLEATGMSREDLAGMFVVKGYESCDDAGRAVVGSFTLDMAKDIVEEIIRKEGNIRLVIIDTANAFMGAGVDAHRNNEVRELLKPLIELAKENNLAVLLLHHNKKDIRGLDPLQMIGGSGAWGEACRAAFMAVPNDTDNPELCEFTIECIKTNNGKPGRRFKYRTEGATVKGDGEDVQTSRVVIEGVADKSVAEILRSRGKEDKGATKTEAMNFLEATLAKGPMPIKELEALAEKAGISRRTMFRAKGQLPIATRRGGFGDGGAWELLSDDGQGPASTADSRTGDDTVPD